MPEIEDDGFVTVHHSNHVATQGTRRELIEKGVLPAGQNADPQSSTDYGRLERIAFQAESYLLVMDGEHINIGAVVRALYTDHRRLMTERRHIIEERDRSFALVLARAEAAEARLNVYVPDGMVEALRAGQQADRDGTTVVVSRQACEEAATILASLKGGA